MICGESVDQAGAVTGQTVQTYNNWRDVIKPLHGTTRVRVTRTIVYEGDANWVGKTLDRSAIQDTGEAEFVKHPNFHQDCTLICTEEKIETL